MVVLPDHLHAVRLPEGDADFPLRSRKLKARFGRSVGGSYRRSDSKIPRANAGLAAAVWEHMIATATIGMWSRLLVSPVSTGWSAQSRDWPLASFHRDAAARAVIGRALRRGKLREA